MATAEAAPAFAVRRADWMSNATGVMYHVVRNFEGVVGVHSNRFVRERGLEARVVYSTAGEEN